MVWPNRGAAWANLLIGLNVLSCGKRVTGVGKRQHFFMSLAAKRHRPYCLSRPWGGLSPFSTISPSPRRERRRARSRNHCSFHAALPLERRERLMARHRGRLLYCAGPRRAALYVDRPLSPPGVAFWAKRNSGRAGPRWPCSWQTARPSGGAPGAARVREKRPLPAAGAESDPTRLMRAPSRGPDLGIISYRIKVEMRAPMTGHCLSTIVTAVPAIPIHEARPCLPKRDHRDKPGVDS